jgi:hypothetical protein
MIPLGCLPRRMLLSIVIGCILIVVPASSTRGAPAVLADFRFTGNGNDTAGNSPPMDLTGVPFFNGTLYFAPSNAFASARINGFSYSSFTVSLDFNPCNFAAANRTILCGGPAYRWISFDNDEGALVIGLNNWSRLYRFDNISLQTNRWHTLVCSVDLGSQRIITFLDGKPMPTIFLQSFQFEVIGTTFEESDKVFLFTNGGFGTTFCGYVDNLKVYSHALTDAEIVSLYAPQLHVTRSEQSVLIYWPLELTGYVLEVNENLAEPNGWATLANQPVPVGNQSVILADRSRGMSLYRLVRR